MQSLTVSTLVSLCVSERLISHERTTASLQLFPDLACNVALLYLTMNALLDELHTQVYSCETAAVAHGQLQ